MTTQKRPLKSIVELWILQRLQIFNAKYAGAMTRHLKTHFLTHVNAMAQLDISIMNALNIG